MLDRIPSYLLARAVKLVRRRENPGPSRTMDTSERPKSSLRRAFASFGAVLIVSRKVHLERPC
jgi:hypothetical protein